MTANRFSYRCATCGAPWKDGWSSCWDCGSTERIYNPEYQRQIQRSRPAPHPPASVPVAHDPISNTPYLIAALAIGVLFGAVALSSVDLGAALLVGVFAASIAWNIAEVTITRKRTERIEAILEDMASGRR